MCAHELEPPAVVCPLEPCWGVLRARASVLFFFTLLWLRRRALCELALHARVLLFSPCLAGGRCPILLLGCAQIGSVSIEAAEKKDMFGIMLDGVVHGPFRRVVITPMYAGRDSEEVVKVPFMTFLPQTV